MNKKEIITYWYKEQEFPKNDLDSVECTSSLGKLVKERALAGGKFYDSFGAIKK